MSTLLVDSLTRLRSFARQPEQRHSQCELCTARLAAEHEHVVELATSRLSCVCEACALLFRNQATARYRTVPRDVSLLRDFRLTDAEWEGLSIPISLAFLFESTRAGGLVAVYPSPAGGTESSPLPDAWRAIVEQNPLLREFAPDVEALLVNRIEGARDYFRVPIDDCYRLVGLVRGNWRGFTGGVAMWSAVTDFLATLKARAGR